MSSLQSHTYTPSPNPNNKNQKPHPPFHILLHPPYIRVRCIIELGCGREARALEGGALEDRAGAAALGSDVGKARGAVLCFFRVVYEQMDE